MAKQDFAPATATKKGIKTPQTAMDATENNSYAQSTPKEKLKEYLAIVDYEMNNDTASHTRSHSIMLTETVWNNLKYAGDNHAGKGEIKKIVTEALEMYFTNYPDHLK